jgi:hypothetical protein
MTHVTGNITTRTWSSESYFFWILVSERVWKNRSSEIIVSFVFPKLHVKMSDVWRGDAQAPERNSSRNPIKSQFKSPIVTDISESPGHIDGKVSGIIWE